MRLIKLAFTSITSTLHDGWEEYITCDDLNNNVLVVKKIVKEISSPKNRIEIKEGEVALVYKDGRFIDATCEPGIYTFDNSGTPTLHGGKLGVKFKEMWENCKDSETKSPEQAIFYVNLNEISDNKFGSSSQVLYPDPEYQNIYIRYYGVYDFKITNPFAFVSYIKDEMNDTFTKEDLMEKVNSEFIKALDASLQKCAKDKIVYSNLSNESLLLAKYVNEFLYDTWNNLIGIEVLNVKLEKITPDNVSRSKIDNFRSSEIETPLTNFKVETETENKIKYCPNCGKEVFGKFCSECGMKIE